MAASDLTAARLRELLAYDPLTGLFHWLVKKGRMKPGDQAGSVKHHGYVGICIDGQHYMAHRLAWLYVHGEWPKGEIDHKFGQQTDNRICVLRDGSPQFNRENMRKPHRDSVSGYLGVSWSRDRKKWLARICHKGKVTVIGAYKTPKGAHAAYVRAKRKIHMGNTL